MVNQQAAAAPVQSQQASLATLPASAQQQHSQNIVDQMLQPVPAGWEISVTSDDELYFINHMNQTTSWYHPHIREYLNQTTT